MPSGLPPPCGGISFTRRTKVFQIRAAERHTATIHSSLFTILFPLAPPGGIPHPGIPRPTSQERQRIAPRRGGGISSLATLGSNAGMQSTLSPA